ncbi:FAD-dependent monooxygenase [Nocardia paucivorans]|uniref:FAD-dependent monooxygenase n=1 Tax=Nocardia paucivorans TaxID=114259 RepID=UPI00031462F9|nr:FAD-dependent monooxygenase [Nocardia paucivorans]
MTITAKRRVLICGASIAGPASAFWLNRYGFEVTVVERASTPRTGGYPIDVRGTAIEVVRRMGLLPILREAHISTKRITFLDADGGTVAELDPLIVVGGSDGDLELARGDLANTLYTAVRDEVEFLFDDSIATLAEHDHGVDVTFDSGTCRTFDLVLGADGMHSRIRRLRFGPEQQFHHYLGYCFAGFGMPNTYGLTNEGVVWNTPGRGAALYTAKNNGELHALLNFTHPEPPFDILRNPDAQRDLVADVFADAGWEIPTMIDVMRDADDLFFDTVGQIRMPKWSRGRVALVGDAAYAPSFLTGQGSSLALVGAYMLAYALAEYPDHTAAFTAYERNLRDFVTANQALVGTGSAALFPSTARDLEQRNNRLRELGSAPTVNESPAHSALTLPDRS